jgi:RNA polymerase sigma-70 factor, ECF subfamily
MLRFYMIVKFVDPSVDIGASDVALLAAIAVQNRGAMELFYRRHASAVFAFGHRRLNDVALADEVVNDTLLQVWHSAKGFAHQSAPKTWVLGIAKNKILDALRNRAREQERMADVPDDERNQFEDTAPSIYQQLLGHQQGEHLLHCFEKLPGEQQSCIHLSFVEGLSLAEIAEVLAIPSNTVATRIHHAKRKLRECMEAIFGKSEVL